MASKILLRIREVNHYNGSVRCIDGLNCEDRFIDPHVAIIAKGNIIEGIEARY